ncbi:MAG: phosphatidate cytidylyltransferase [Gemmataceae bacterium]
MRTRIILGSLLVALVTGMFVVDQRVGRLAPCLFLFALLLAPVGATEFWRMIPAPRRPSLPFCIIASLALLLVHWFPFTPIGRGYDGMALAYSGWTTFLLAAMVESIAAYRAPGEALNRMALTVLLVAYLGFLPGYLVELRLSQADPARGTAALVLAIFVPKICDIGAYFTGSFIGRHRMTPILSPKKTWEGAAGGLICAVVFSGVVKQMQPVIPGGWLGVAAFGVSIGIAGILGDLAESLIKRDSGSKDAGQLLPEFGGILDIVDSIIFAAPLVYWWLK